MPVVDLAEGPLQTRVQVFAPVSLTLGSARGVGFGGIDHSLGNAREHRAVNLRRYVDLDTVVGVSVAGALALIGLGLVLIGGISAGYGLHQAGPLNRIADALDAFATDARVPRLPASGVREV